MAKTLPSSSSLPPPHSFIDSSNRFNDRNETTNLSATSLRSSSHTNVLNSKIIPLTRNGPAMISQSEKSLQEARQGTSSLTLPSCNGEPRTTSKSSCNELTLFSSRKPPVRDNYPSVLSSSKKNQTTPPLPPPPPPPLTASSSPIAQIGTGTQTNNCPRRSIFGESCWSQGRQYNYSPRFRRSVSHNDAVIAMQQMSDKQVSPPPSLPLMGPLTTRPSRTSPRKRAVSLPQNNSVESFFNDKHKNQSLRSDKCRLHGISRQALWEFSPPVERSCLYQGVHLKSIEEMPNLPSLQRLPALPSPLQRLRNHSGVYPLVSPQPILRKKSTIATTPSNRGNDSSDEGKVSDRAMNLSKTLDGALAIIDSHSSLSNSSHSSIGMDVEMGSKECRSNRKVRFDPRVTVTEFDDWVPREWYSEDELERFKYSALLLVKQYLIRHPEAIIEYNTPVFDSVSGLARRKALFSIPVLSCNPIQEDIDKNSMTNALNLEVYRNDMNLLADLQVKSIFVVDRNKKVLDLFQRSLQMIFPKAKIVTAESGEEALKLVRSAIESDINKQRGFDIVIAEERLYIPIQQSPHISNPGTSQQPVRTNGSKHCRINSCNDFSVPKKPKPRTGCWTGLSGSELFEQIKEIEEEVKEFAKSSGKHASEVALSDTQSQCALLVGVSMHPTQDSKAFMESGADIVWGKPPPHMNTALRNQLILKLLQKRNPLSI